MTRLPRDEDGISRREALALAGTGATAALLGLAGCSGPNQVKEPTTGEGNGTDGGLGGSEEETSEEGNETDGGMDGSEEETTSNETTGNSTEDGAESLGGA